MAQGLAVREQRSAVVGEGDSGELAAIRGGSGAHDGRVGDVGGVAGERELPTVVGEGDDMPNVHSPPQRAAPGTRSASGRVGLSTVRRATAMPRPVERTTRCKIIDLH